MPRNASKQVLKLELDLRGTRADLLALPAPADMDGLSATLRRIAKKGDLEKSLEDAREKLADGSDQSF